ncbi:MAG: threonine synthase [Oceanospirillales bacterium]|uniref:Threonine synthase n=1 Tax=Marinobacterium halophilum TaxID=267374 RepID=A0A2P8ET91_9GAMM|nr:threonine synthase [Marinobacterium halophilum]MBR9827819.1 threonine synthase [Oceanospirillales bacterium]PSL12696.1 L-threonine synthase [Marinobacterium halophilum]
MNYISTRGQAPKLNFAEVLLAGMANDGGLYVPEQLPTFSRDEIASWAGLSYAELAFKVIRPFIGDCISEADLKRMIDETYAGFNHSAVAPLKELGTNEWVLELFHGPTLAFKDFALQLLGRLMDHVLAERGERLVIMGATSGDTGSAAIEGCRHSEHLDIFILHPYNRVSEVQRRQMTTIKADNVFNIALEGNFDDCQEMVKDSFADQSFLGGLKLGAVNSINWARIMSQIVYYFSAALAVGGPHRPVSFSVPTGNFGDIFAGYLAKQMGLPIEQLVVATNRNDILHRVISGNDMSKGTLEHTLSPSMDIMVSSNFERLLFDVYDRDGAAIADLMRRFKTESVQLDGARWDKVRELFDSLAVDDETTCQVIRDVHAETGYLLDPHTAIGVQAARECWRDKAVPMITLATAHPVKFPEPVIKAGLEAPQLPAHMADLFEREERMQVLPNALSEVQSYIATNAHRG